MKILLVNVFFSPQSIGGATRVVEDNVRFFQDDPNIAKTAVFCSLIGAREHGSSRHYNFANTQVKAVATQLVDNSDFLLSDSVIREQFSEYLDYFCPDIIHFHCIQRLTTDIVFEAQRRKIPYVITMHDGWWISDYQFLLDRTGEVQTYDYKNIETTRARFDDVACERQEILANALEGASLLLTVSPEFRAVVEQSGLENIEVIQNGVSALERLKKSKSDKLNIGYLAGISHSKGYYNLRSVLTKRDYKNIRLVLVDHSVRYGNSLTEFWGSTEVQRIGFVPQEEVASLYQKLNAVIVPSLWPESYGLVAREALLTGCWLLASSRGAASSDIVEGENGYVFDPSSPDDLDRVLCILNLDPERHFSEPPALELPSSDVQARALIARYKDLLRH